MSLTGRSGSRYVLRFSTNAVCLIQGALGKPLVEVLRDQIRHAITDVAAMRTIVHLSLIEPSDASLVDAGDVIDDVGMVDTQRAIVEALQVSNGQHVDPEWRKIQVNAAAIGILPDRFWGMTFDDLSIAREGASILWREIYNALLYHAWHTAAFARMNKMPSLKSLLKHDDQPEQPKSAELIAAEQDMDWRVRRAVMRRKAAMKQKPATRLKRVQ